jgi:uncharacterized protein (DUF1800 family)
MKSFYQIAASVTILCLVVFLCSFNTQHSGDRVSFPYKKAGLTERQAAAHLLSRFTFGARPGQIDEVVKMGLEKWFEQQLDAGMPDKELNDRLAGYDALRLSNTDIVNTYVRPAQLLKMAVSDGIINKDSINKGDKQGYRETLMSYSQQKGLKTQRVLLKQLADQKILRAVYTNNQLQEVLTDFWFNHFNVSATKNDCVEFIPNYERDVIRPGALGKFEDLLLVTAKSPAMLFYLDNFISSGSDSSINRFGAGQFRTDLTFNTQVVDSSSMQANNNLKNRRKNQGLNENYARELMELHTLGVDGGYSQGDVTQAARVLTGWTVYPMGDYGVQNALRKVIERVGEERLAKRGYKHDGDFLFVPNRHDIGEKVVLGKKFPSEAGYEEGVQLLSMLAHHPSTAKFISRKIAIRFVSDHPSQVLVDRMARTFLDKDGDISKVLLTMVASPEFWTADAVREKTKSPFELAISSVRSIDAEVRAPFQLYNWIERMGQKLYFYQAPTGYPDKAEYWINTGALLNRMNFGLALASQRIPGVTCNLLALNQGHEPESAEAALITFGKLMMPERDLKQTIVHLTPLLRDPQLQQKIEEKTAVRGQDLKDDRDQIILNSDDKQVDVATHDARQEPPKGNNMLSQVVGIILGSPEFQRR